MRCGIAVFLCLRIILVTVEEIDSFDIDYYFMRSSSALVDCDSEKFNFACSVKCNTKYYCMFGKCFCILDGNNKMNTKFDFKHNNVMYMKDPRAEQSEEDYTQDISDEDDYDRIDRPPALRHHIAHFCENLDTARECIRKCMQSGKPAFCGKDHVCYCGHKSGYPTKDKEVDADEMYSVFQDLYARYFGSTEKNLIHKAVDDEE